MATGFGALSLSLEQTFLCLHLDDPRVSIHHSGSLTNFIPFILVAMTLPDLTVSILSPLKDASLVSFLASHCYDYTESF